MKNGILAGFFESRASMMPSFKVSQTPPAYVSNWGGWDTTTGVDVTPDRALQLTAVYACVRILAESIASLPLHLYRRLDGGGKERAITHPLYNLLHSLPNPEMTAYNLRETLTGHLALRGNCYSEIEYSGGGQVLALWPLRPDKVEEIKRENGRLVYGYRLPEKVGGELKWLDQRLVLHVRTFGNNGIIGYSPIQYARNAIGLGMATEQYGGEFFGNGAQPGGVLEHPQSLSDKAYGRLKESWEKRHQGLDKSHRIAILEEGMKYHEISVSPDDAQFLETRKFQTNEIARLYRIPPHMIADLDKATFSNIEHLSIQFVVQTLYPYLVNWEQEISRSLLSDSERKAFFAEHLVTGLLRGDVKSRYEAYHMARQDGWLSANDIRELENMNPIEGGDVYLVPLNMVPANQLESINIEPGTRALDKRNSGGSETTTLETPEERGRRGARKRHKLIGVYRNLYEQTAERVLRREIGDLKQAAGKYLRRRDLGQFNAWLSEYYQAHEEFVRTAFGPVDDAYALVVAESAASEIKYSDDLKTLLSTFLLAYLYTFSARHVGTSVNQVRQTLQKAIGDKIDLGEAIDSLTQHWLEMRPGMIADEETVRLNNATAKEVYRAGGIGKLQWVAFGESCPYCDDLDGKTVGIDENFLDADTDYKPDGADRPLRTASNIGHAPAHDGCDCMIASA